MHNVHKPTPDELPSSSQLIKSTLAAIAAAALILVVAVLPGEYGIDPTGVGKVLGLKRMGDIKLQLAQEAEQDQQAVLAAAKMPVTDQLPMTDQSVAEAQVVAPVAVVKPAAPVKPVLRTAEMSVVLTPGQGAEIKLEMLKGKTVTYVWSGNGGLVNYDAHGDIYDAPQGFYYGYGQGRKTPEMKGTLKAAFDGYHGWFWRNRSDQNVTLTLRVEGDYIDIKRMM